MVDDCSIMLTGYTSREGGQNLYRSSEAVEIAWPLRAPQRKGDKRKDTWRHHIRSQRRDWMKGNMPL